MKHSIPHCQETLFLSPSDVAGLVRSQGMAATLQGLEAYIRQDFLRWSGLTSRPAWRAIHRTA